MKHLCAFDNVACLIGNMPETLPQIALIALPALIAAAFATLTYRSL